MVKTHDADNKIVIPIQAELQKNIDALQGLFENCSDFIGRKFTIGGEYRTSIYIAYIDNMVDKLILEQNILNNIINRMDSLPESKKYQFIRDRAMQTADMSEKKDMDSVVLAILAGDVALFVDGYTDVFVLSLKDYPGRGVGQVESEVTLRGAKDAFTESIAINKVLVRRRIKDTRLKIEGLEVGERSRSFMSIAYMDGIVQKDVVEELKRELNSFSIDGVFDVGMLAQLINRRWISPFPNCQSTERPDKAASALLEGRVVVLLDNSPMVLLLPTTVSSFFQAADDYYSHWMIVSFVRILRYIGALLSIGLPGLYIAVTNYQPELIPTPLLLSLSAARQGVPFSILIEVIILQAAFELLSEAGVRLPSPMGNTIGVVGGLIIGQAAISANLVSPMVVIVVAFTAISSFTIPNEGFTTALRIARYMIIVLSAVMGMYGFIVGTMLVLIHLAGLKSFGIPYLSPFAAADHLKENPLGDSLLKFPVYRLRRRPIYACEEEEIRLSYKNDGEGAN